jgi:hypothetical protein
MAGSAIGRSPARPSTRRWHRTGSRTSGGSRPAASSCPMTESDVRRAQDRQPEKMTVGPPGWPSRGASQKNAAPQSKSQPSSEGIIGGRCQCRGYRLCRAGARAGVAESDPGGPNTAGDGRLPLTIRRARPYRSNEDTRRLDHIASFVIWSVVCGLAVLPPRASSGGGV